jgi:hypothetical protein
MDARFARREGESRVCRGRRRDNLIFGQFFRLTVESAPRVTVSLAARGSEKPAIQQRITEPKWVSALKRHVAAAATQPPNMRRPSPGYILFINERLAMNTSPNFRLVLPGILAAITLATFSMAAFADDIKFKLSGDMEVPPVTTKAAGDVALTIQPDMSVSGKVTTSGLAGTMAHIHIGKAGANGPVVITLDKNGDNGWTVPQGSKLSAEQYQAYKAGELYVNVHSADHKPGEIRGQVMPPMAAKSSY